MSKEELLETLSKYSVMPVITIESVDSAVPMADAMIEGGLPVAEITFRTEAAVDVMARLKKERPDMILGAGTILSVGNLRRAKEAGAWFGVAPGFNPEVVKEAQKLDMLFIPGIVTPSEVEQAMALGCNVLKFFPAEASGGMAMINCLAAPYGHTGVKFMPTGGINMENVETYLASDIVWVVGGTWIAKKDVIAAGDWDTIRNNCRETMKMVKRVRG